MSYQQLRYDEAYSKADLTPFPDHKITDGVECQKGKKIVSFGGGIGLDIVHLAQDHEIIIVDYSDSSRSIVQHLGMHFEQVDLNAVGLTLPWHDSSFDVVILKDILEHLVDPLVVLSECRRILKTDGYMIISIPNHFTLFDRIRILFGSNLIWKGILHDHTRDYSEWNYMHIRFFTWRGTKQLIQSARLKIDRKFFDIGPFGHYFSVSSLVEHLEIKRENGIITNKGGLFLRYVAPFVKVISLLFPKSMRVWLCERSPQLFTSCYYLRVVRQ